MYADVYVCVGVCDDISLHLLSMTLHIVILVIREFLISMYVTWHFIVPRSSIASRVRELDFQFDYM